jgi:hypothetical protein
MCEGIAEERLFLVAFALFGPIVQIFWECQRAPDVEGRVVVPLHVSSLVTEVALARL